MYVIKIEKEYAIEDLFTHNISCFTYEKEMHREAIRRFIREVNWHLAEKGFDGWRDFNSPLSAWKNLEVELGGFGLSTGMNKDDDIFRHDYRMLNAFENMWWLSPKKGVVDNLFFGFDMIQQVKEDRTRVTNAVARIEYHFDEELWGKDE
jgi:hypothetical protein